MNTLFAPPDRQQILDRLGKLQEGAARQWGKMNPAQMCAHVTISLEVAAGDVTLRQGVLGRLLGWIPKASVFGGDKPLMKNSPTDPTYVVSDPRDFSREKERLAATAKRFGEAGPAGADGRVHPFFGKLTGDEWGVLMWKHLDHHLRQFGA